MVTTAFTTAQRIKLRRKILDITQQELADLCQVNRATVSSWERGAYVPDGDSLRRLSAILEVSTDYILCHDLNFPSGMDSNMHPTTENAPRPSKFLNIPVLSREMTACCGNGLPALDITSEPVEFIPWPRDDFRSLDDMRPPFAIYVSGDCLESINIRDGDKVIINPAEEPAQGTVALVRYHGVQALRYVYQLRNGDVILRCDVGRTRLTEAEQEESEFVILGTLIGSLHPRPPALPL